MVANSNAIVALQSRKSSFTTCISSLRPQQPSFDFKIPILIGAVAVVASEPQDPQQIREDFENWINEEVIPRHRDVNEVISEVIAKAALKKESELEAVFPGICRMVMIHAATLMDEEDFDSVLALLDAQWNLSTRVNGLFSFPYEMALLLSLEADAHRGKRDYEAMKRSRKMLWTLLQRYAWLGESDWGQKMRRHIALSLAIDYSTAGDCDAAKYLLQECVQYSRVEAYGSREEDPDAIKESAEATLELLSTSLRAYYFMKRLIKSPCAPLFEYAARDVYDLIFTQDPKLLPFWHDMKVNVRRSFDGQLKNIASQQEALRGLNPSNNAMPSTSLEPEKQSTTETDSRFVPSSLLLQPKTPTL